MIIESERLTLTNKGDERLMTEQENKTNKEKQIVNVAITLTGKTKKYTKGKIVEVPTSYKTLISLPVFMETEVEGKIIIDRSFYDYTMKKIIDKFSEDKVRDTLLHLYDSGGYGTNGLLRDDKETSLDKKLERKGMFHRREDEEEYKVEYESKVEISYGKYTGNSKFDKITHYDDLMKRRTIQRFNWLSVLSFTDDSSYGSYSKNDEEECSEEYTNLIWNVWNKHLEGNIKEYSVYFTNSRDYEEVKYTLEVYDHTTDRSEKIWKPKKKVITGTIKGITKYDAIQKYNNNETDIENMKYVSVDEVAEDSIKLGGIGVCCKSIQPNEIPKENDLLSVNLTKKEMCKDFILPDNAKEVV
jgi:hypothetical protein